ncbi:hypothetical protein V8G54_019291 [Vigna mungo]|uniref:UBL3-like ubiquitin domain-containing protein n=1 Tax=Vigna mungo TaxID=3915 RepID=A0AAQ3NAC0_VIGMU
MPEEEVVELKFRLYDGSDMGPFRYSPASTVSMLKDRIFAEILENNRTVGQCRVPLGELPKGVIITMHVVVQPPLLKAKTVTVFYNHTYIPQRAVPYRYKEDPSSYWHGTLGQVLPVVPAVRAPFTQGHEQYPQWYC